MNKNFFVFIILFFLQYLVKAQVPVGSWRDHLSYSNVKRTVVAGNKIFAATALSMFSYNKSDNSIEKFSKANLLSDIGISSINYDEKKQVFVIGYQNGNIDFIQNKNIINLSDIKRKALPANNQINNIRFINGKIYLACGFGIVVVDFERKEIADTYYIGENASYINVFDIAFDGNFLYAATEKGIFKADINSSNIIDFNEWKRITSLSNFDKSFNAIAYFGNNLVTNNLNNESGNLYYFDGVSWRDYPVFDNEIKGFSVNNNKLVCWSKNKIYVFDSNRNLLKSIMNNVTVNHAVVDENGTIWVGDENNALVRIISNNDFTNISPNGPYYNDVVDITAKKGIIWAVGGGKDAADVDLWRFCQAYSFINENWKSYLLFDKPYRDFVCVTINPFNTTQVFAGAWWGGVFEFSKGNLVKHYTNDNSTLQSITSGQPQIRISAMEIDADGNLWVANSAVKNPISVKKTDYTWKSFNFNNSISNYRTGKLIITKNNHKWLQIVAQPLLFIFDDKKTIENTNDDKYRTIPVLINENGSLISSESTAIAEGLDGSVWIGTNKGIGIYYNPEEVFTSSKFYAERIKIKRNPKDSTVQYLLRTEYITSIAVDGADRKWIGTNKSGIYLISKDGSSQLAHFTTDNSKLISNSINSIAINQQTSEVFIGTDLGLVSYRGNATMGTDDFNDVYAFPNPVRHGYNGDITIKGLVADVNVKITDITGNIVFETKANGGMATWSGKNFRGERVKTGVYLVFFSNEDGSKTYITKILFIN